MTQSLFGTDGIRGRANTEPMTAVTALKVAMAAGSHFLSTSPRRHLAIIGKDTRLSGYMLEPALVSGLTSVGMDVIMLGPLPTPAVAMLTRSMRADLGIMISASHNPFEDNGIKLFGPDGYKLSDELEMQISRAVLSNEMPILAPPAKLGRARRLGDEQGRYIEFVKNTFPRGLVLDGLKIVVDCANGAAYKVAPTVLRELGAEVIPIAVTPDGTNINRECGATHTSLLQGQVVAHGAHIGIALDGDADRLIVVDEYGQVIDGDQLMALIAGQWHREDRLAGGGLVATVMSNMGLERYLEGMKLELRRTKVGDRNVLEEMRRDGFNVGGEQSGHIILTDYATTGDGLLAALQVLAVLVSSKQPVSRVARVFQPFPQILKNVRFKTGQAPLEEDEVKTAIESAEHALKGTGRLLIRKSGTEPLIRIMAEGEDQSVVTDVVDRLFAVVERVVTR
ncbi:phosphoglucosamine mutase [Lacibacterium aquatile]|uniref:Phosphoglucosamine mutase n=1 Tax=Lacibacterium aquatile TaxID=1168082 RepID=A0ABW5DR56_9PROT